MKSPSIGLVLLFIFISFTNCKKSDSSEKNDDFTIKRDSIKKEEDRRVKSIGPDPFGIHDKKHNFILYVSNQSFSISPVDIKVYIDGILMINSNFEVKRQHNWKEFRFNLSEGTHKLRVESEKGKASLKTEFSIKNKHWSVINYWYYPGSYQKIPRKFTFEISGKPIGFM